MISDIGSPGLRKVRICGRDKEQSSGRSVLEKEHIQVWASGKTGSGQYHDIWFSDLEEYYRPKRNYKHFSDQFVGKPSEMHVDVLSERDAKYVHVYWTTGSISAAMGRL
ncbi:hypothetical protein QYM36_005154 [Artemia franciscana]|uniref:Uncharacterized protein n=1 Tax=Artemia franciscana TaxID=6661 RepID=A0AA88ID36_ARTSF|nr:hypothetical protein QYM36_005154 [Artemia franciscana]